MRDYTEIALESLLLETSIWRNMTANRLMMESEFILMSLQEGKICEFALEATASETSKKLLNALTTFLNEIVAKFEQKASQYYQKYIPWVEKNADKIKEKAADGSLTLAPYWKANVKKDTTTMTNLPAKAYKYPFDESDISFAKDLLPSITKPEDLSDTGKLSSMLKNKFRFGIDESENNKIVKEELKGSALVSQIDGMISYVTNYKSLSSDLKKISTSLKNSAQKFQDAVSESTNIMSKDKFLMIEMCGLDHTDLSLLEGFDCLPDSLLEAEEGNGGSLTKVENNVKEEKSEDNRQKNPASNSQSRYQQADKFTRLAFTAFMTACEERFIVYIKCMSQILGESPKSDK